eukprot:7483154-Ditylum_brightwellii.AAC.1
MGDTAGQKEETGHIYYSIQSVQEYTCNCRSINMLNATVETIKKARNCKENGPFIKFMTDNDLVDAYKHMHPESHPATYLQGQKRLDYVLITPGLLPALWAIGYLPFHTGHFSDHCALWADFDLE